MSIESSEIRLPSTAVRGRLRWLLLAFVILLFTVFGRLVALEVRRRE